jgi:hypothetical protein
MYTNDQVETWGLEHLTTCHWYIEMPFANTPPHEQQNRRSLEPSFKTPELVSVQPSKTGSTSKAGSRKERVKSKSGVTLVAAAWEDGPGRSNKHSQMKSTIETAKKAKHDDNPQSQPNHDEVNQSHSENRSSKFQPLTVGGISGNELGFRHLLLKRNHGGKEFDELFMNTSVVDFMDSKECCSLRDVHGEGEYWMPM